MKEYERVLEEDDAMTYTPPSIKDRLSQSSIGQIFAAFLRVMGKKGKV